MFTNVGKKVCGHLKTRETWKLDSRPPLEEGIPVCKIFPPAATPSSEVSSSVCLRESLDAAEGKSISPTEAGASSTQHFTLEGHREAGDSCNSGTR